MGDKRVDVALGNAQFAFELPTVDDMLAVDFKTPLLEVYLELCALRDSVDGFLINVIHLLVIFDLYTQVFDASLYNFDRYSLFSILRPVVCRCQDRSKRLYVKSDFLCIVGCVTVWYNSERHISIILRCMQQGSDGPVVILVIA